MTLFDISKGDKFKWREDTYRLVSIDDNGDWAHVRRLNPHTGRWNGLSRFNPYAKIEREIGR